MLLSLVLLTASPAPVIKTGTCPLGWYSSGSYCVPASHSSPPAIQKAGTCPLGWSTSSQAYCVKR